MLVTSLTLKRYYAIYSGHQKCSYFDTKQYYLKHFYSENNLSSNAEVINSF